MVSSVLVWGLYGSHLLQRRRLASNRLWNNVGSVASTADGNLGYATRPCRLSRLCLAYGTIEYVCSKDTSIVIVLMGGPGFGS